MSIEISQKYNFLFNFMNNLLYNMLSLNLWSVALQIIYIYNDDVLIYKTYVQCCYILII